MQAARPVADVHSGEMTAAESPRPSLRERKKAKTRSAIQRHALRLFRTQGYGETTVEQIAEAAEVSPSTFFRYFPTKEDVVLYDDLDPAGIAAIQAQPADVPPLTAVRNALHTVFDQLANEERAQVEDRLQLFRTVPEVRARLLDQFASDLQVIADVLAERVGRPTHDFAVRVFAGAIVGVGISIMLQTIDDPNADFVALFDQGLAQLEAGLTL